MLEILLRTSDFILLPENSLLFGVTAVISLLAGSFLNVVIYRLPLMLRYRLNNSAGAELSLAQPRSHCPNCKRTLRAYDNIPLISYLLLRGRCAFCQSKIHCHYPLVELFSLILSLMVVARWGLSLNAAAGLILTWFLLALAAIDLQKLILPDEMTLSLLWIGLMLSLAATFTDPVSAIIGAVSGYVFFWIINRFFFAITRKQGLGYGDMKLLAACGAWFGWQALPALVILASASGLMVSASLLAAGKISSGQQIPFGPYLCLGAWTVMMIPYLPDSVHIWF